MTLFEILNFNRELLERLAGTGYKPDDYKYIDLYREYEQMRRKGDKVTYCVAFLSARHGVSERKVYEILGRFKRNVRSIQYEKSGTFAFLGRRDELCIRNINTQLHDRMTTAMKSAIIARPHFLLWAKNACSHRSSEKS